MKRSSLVPLETSFALKSPRNSRPDAMLALVFGSLALLTVGGFVLLELSSKSALSMIRLILPASALSGILSLLGLIFSIRGLIFFIRGPGSRRGKELIFVIIGFIFSTPVLLLILFFLGYFLFLLISFSNGGAPHPG